MRFGLYMTLEQEFNLMLKAIFEGMLEISNAYYGDAIGLAPIVLAAPQKKSQDFWRKECEVHPTNIACLNYES